MSQSHRNVDYDYNMCEYATAPMWKLFFLFVHYFANQPHTSTILIDGQDQKKNISIWQCVRHYALYVDNRKIGAIEIEMTSIWLICRSNWVQCQIFRFFFFFRFYYTPDFTILIIYDMTISRITCENTQFAHLLGFFCSMGELIKEKWMKPIDFVEKCWFGRASSKNQTYSTDFLFLVRFFFCWCVCYFCHLAVHSTSSKLHRQ